MKTIFSKVLLTISRFYAFLLDFLFYGLLSYFICLQLLNKDDINLVFLTTILIKSAHEHIRDGLTIGKTLICLEFTKRDSVNYTLRNFLIFSPIILLSFCDNVLHIRYYEFKNIYYLMSFTYLIYIITSVIMLFNSRKFLHDYICKTIVVQKPINVAFIVFSSMISIVLYYFTPFSYMIATKFTKALEVKSVYYTDFNNRHCKYSRYNIPFYGIWDNKLEIDKSFIDPNLGIHYFQNEVSNGRQLKQSFLGQHVRDNNSGINDCFDEYYIFINNPLIEKEYFEMAEYFSGSNNHSAIYNFVFYKEIGWFYVFYKKTIFGYRDENGKVNVYRDREKNSNYLYFGINGEEDIHKRILVYGSLL